MTGRMRLEAAAERAAREVAEQERAAARGELDGLKLGLEHHHLELAQMRQEVAEAHNRAVVAEQQIIEATKRREGAEVALAKARSSFAEQLAEKAVVISPNYAVRPEGANHQWRKIPPGELSIASVADERLGRVTGWVEAS